MIAVIQRVSAAEVRVRDKKIGKIKRGLVILLGVAQTDEGSDADYLAEKAIHLRIFEDDEGKMNRSLLDVGGEVLAISQFTLLANTRKGRRPSFIEAAPPDLAIPLYQQFMESIRSAGIHLEQGEFGAMMDVQLVNQGPVTIILNSHDRHQSRKG